MLRTIRSAAGLTQQQLAAKAGVRQQVVSRIETGRSQPTLPTLRRLVEAAGGRVGYDVEAPPDPHDLALLAVSLSRSVEERYRSHQNLHRFVAAGRAAVAESRRAS